MGTLSQHHRFSSEHTAGTAMVSSWAGRHCSSPSSRHSHSRRRSSAACSAAAAAGTAYHTTCNADGAKPQRGNPYRRLGIPSWGTTSRNPKHVQGACACTLSQGKTPASVLHTACLQATMRTPIRAPHHRSQATSVYLQHARRTQVDTTSSSLHTCPAGLSA